MYFVQKDYLCCTFFNGKFLFNCSIEESAVKEQLQKFLQETEAAVGLTEEDKKVRRTKCRKRWSLEFVTTVSKSKKVQSFCYSSNDDVDVMYLS